MGCRLDQPLDFTDKVDAEVMLKREQGCDQKHAKHENADGEFDHLEYHVNQNNRDQQSAGSDQGGIHGLSPHLTKAPNEYYFMRKTAKQGSYILRLKNCTARSCLRAAESVLKVPKLRRFPVLGFFLRE